MDPMSNELVHVYVIGMGEVGRRLAGALERSGIEVRAVTRSSGWEAAASDERGIRLLCMREDDLPAALERLREVPPHLLVAVQNGWIRPMLEPFQGCGRGLIWFMSKGDYFNQLRPSPFTGAAGSAVAEALARGGLEVTTAAEPEFSALEAEKMGFNCVVGLPLAVHGVTLGEYLDRFPDEAQSVFEEATRSTSKALGVPWREDWWPAFVRTVEPLHWVASGQAKALRWRNGAVVELARSIGTEAPANHALLNAIGYQS